MGRSVCVVFTAMLVGVRAHGVFEEVGRDRVIAAQRKLLRGLVHRWGTSSIWSRIFCVAESAPIEYVLQRRTFLFTFTSKVYPTGHLTETSEPWSRTMFLSLRRPIPVLFVREKLSTGTNDSERENSQYEKKSLSPRLEPMTCPLEGYVLAVTNVCSCAHCCRATKR